MVRNRNRRRWGGRWEEIRELGRGGQGRAYLVRDMDTNDMNADSTGWVLKELHNPHNARRKRRGRFEREIAAVARLRSAHIPMLVDRSPSGATATYYVTQFVGKNLETLEAVTDPRALLQRFRGVVVAVQDAHSQGIIHRDIKPNNITVDDGGTPFLVDFGICADEKSESALKLTGATEPLGSRSFAAPECEPGNVDSIREWSDVYSLGKVLYWMASGKKPMYREDFDPHSLIFTDPVVCQYFPVLIESTVREDPSTRWSVTQLLNGVDRALAKLHEHVELRDAGIVVLADGFGSSNECNEGAFNLSTTPPQGNPPADHDLAEAFFVREAVKLHRIDLGLKPWSVAGRMAEVLLVQGDLEGPSENVIERWDVALDDPGILRVVEMVSASRPTLEASEVYWVILSARGDNTAIAWVAAVVDLAECVSHFAERNLPDSWEVHCTLRGPTRALRVLARAEK